jgi:hypothetical protein
MAKKKRSKGKKSKDKIEPLKKPKKRKQRKGTKAIMAVIILLAVLVILLVFFALVQGGYVENPLDAFGHVEQKFDVRDECSMILGNLIHTVNDEGVCEQKCHAQCDVREMEFVRSEFKESLVDCHTCNCYCK